MPNWCENDFKATGKAEDIKAFLKAMYDNAEITAEQIMAKDDVLPFNRIIPYPKAFADQDEVAQAARAAGNYNVKDGFNDGGYFWCVRNWGTKWPAGEGHNVEIKIPKSGNGKAVVKMTFDTAWSPPKPIITALSQMFPLLVFGIKYYEAGMAFKGVFAAQNDNVLEDMSVPYNGPRGG